MQATACWRIGSYAPDMVPYIGLYKAVCDLSYICIWYPIFVYIRQCVTCLICIWYPIFVYVSQCVTCLIDVYGTLYLFM